MQNQEQHNRPATCWLLAALLTCATARASADDVDDALAAIGRAGPQAIGSKDAREARDLMAGAGVEVLPRLLIAMDTPNVVAANWFRTAYEEIVDRELVQPNRAFPLDDLRKFVVDSTRRGRVRRHLFAFFGTGDVVSVDFAGRLAWQRSLASEFGAFENRFAAASSPLVHDGLLLLQCDHYGASYLLAIDKATGADRWKADRPEAWLSWSSPQLAPTGREGQHELLVCGSHKLDAFDPLTGAKLWTVQGFARECVPTPVVGDGLIYATSGPNGQTICVRPGGRGDVTGTHVVWTSPRGAPFVPSAIVVGDYYYVADDKGIGTCLDRRTGEMVWRKRFGGAFTASPVAGDGKLYFCDEEDGTLVIASGMKSYRELAHNQLNEPMFASPAISQGRLFLRTTGHLYCIGR